MNDELFPPDAGAALSPKLRWMRSHAVLVAHFSHCEEAPWCAWLRTNCYADEPDGVPINPDLCGYGETEDEALASLAEKNEIRLWNEETETQKEKT